MALTRTPFTMLTGVAADNQIPSFNASKINAGIFAVARIPNLSASKINSGTLDIARIPAANNSSIVGSGFGGFRYTLTGPSDDRTLNLFTN